MSILTDDIQAQLAAQAIELPSWAFGNSGTRFKVFATPGTPRDPYEKIADAAQVHRYTALAPTVALSSALPSKVVRPDSVPQATRPQPRPTETSVDLVRTAMHHLRTRSSASHGPTAMG